MKTTKIYAVGIHDAQDVLEANIPSFEEALKSVEYFNRYKEHEDLTTFEVWEDEIDEDGECVNDCSLLVLAGDDLVEVIRNR